MPEPSARHLAIIIPTIGRWEILRRTLSALDRQTVTGFEVVVVVDGNMDPPDLGDARLIVREHGGPGAARNAGTKNTDRPLVLFLGDDMVPSPRLVEHHVAMHGRKPELEVAVLGHVDLHAHVRRNRLNRWMDWSATQFDYRNVTGSEAGFGRFYSCNVSIKKKFFLGSGGFDEDFVYFYEDLDCGWRLGRAGMRLLYEPRAVAHHMHPLTWTDVVRRFQGVARGERMMAAKHDWFEPYFRRRIERALQAQDFAGFWRLVVDHVPSRWARLRRGAEARADTWYYQRLAPHFLEAWESVSALEQRTTP